MVPVSVFIMDVTKSSTAGHGEEISNYITQLERDIGNWHGNIGSVQIKHRSGDELILLSEGYASAFITAFFISSLWKYEKNPPYFGITYGSLDKKVEEIDIEKWIHPLVKQARNANDHLKKQKDRESFHLQLNDVEPSLQIINSMFMLQHVLRIEQTDIQQLVCSLYLIYGKQNAVAQLLDRSAPTIYSHFKKGHCEQIIRSFRDIVSFLNARQASDFYEVTNNQSDVLEESIRTNIKSRVQELFNI
ncbi:hypothetical protein LC048_08305 [Mesobacillus subterraneus]|uniref:hypothetical protein n=1 Tax=Mesobacillus subterraneus TaxID=285983 RepID=UPI001CFDE0B4|nr:hypothetical protein [Mesobacillus subterraneus]WLR56857.1 hypothetical protein LC048_08305 [Mesobacillus subterraneus]